MSWLCTTILNGDIRRKRYWPFNFWWPWDWDKITQNLIDWSLDYVQPFRKISLISSFLVILLTDKQTDIQTDIGENVTSFAEVISIYKETKTCNRPRSHRLHVACYNYWQLFIRRFRTFCCILIQTFVVSMSRTVSTMGGAAYKTGFASGACEKKLYPHFSICVGTSNLHISTN